MSRSVVVPSSKINEDEGEKKKEFKLEKSARFCIVYTYDPRLWKSLWSVLSDLERESETTDKEWARKKKKQSSSNCESDAENDDTDNDYEFTL